jgi:DNA-binding XRE family transcriptional regulator
MKRRRAKTRQPRTVLEWLDRELGRDRQFRRQVEETLDQMRIQQDLATLRQRRNVSQRQLARILGVSQPAIAKIESGKVKNLELRTLVRYAVALGGRVHIGIGDEERAGRKRRAPRSRTRRLAPGSRPTPRAAKVSR